MRDRRWAGGVAAAGGDAEEGESGGGEGAVLGVVALLRVLRLVTGVVEFDDKQGGEGLGVAEDEVGVLAVDLGPPRVGLRGADERCDQVVQVDLRHHHPLRAGRLQQNAVERRTCAGEAARGPAAVRPGFGEVEFVRAVGVGRLVVAGAQELEDEAEAAGWGGGGGHGGDVSRG